MCSMFAGAHKGKYEIMSQRKKLLVGNYDSDGGSDEQNAEETEAQETSEGVLDCVLQCWSAKIVTVEPLFFIYAFGVAFFIPMFQQYLYQRYGRARILNVTTSEEYFCLNETYLDHVAGNGTNDAVEGDSTRLVFYVTITDIVTSVTAGLVIGPLTDRYGRKMALLLASFSSLLGTVVIICTVYLSLDLRYFILTSFVSASLGGYLVMSMATLAYIADVSTKETRTLRIGVLQAVQNVAQTLAFVISGVWLQETQCDFRPLVWVIVVCYSLSIFYTIFMFPESLSYRQRINRTAEKTKGLSAIWNGLQLFFRPKLVTAKLWVGLLALCIAQVNLNGALLIGTYFFIHKPLHWHPDQIGYFGSYNSILHGAMLTIGLPVAVVLGLSDLLLCIAALLISSGAYTLIGFVTTSWQMYAIGVILSFEAITVPTIRSILSKLVSTEEQGVLFAFVSSMESAGIATGSAVYGNLYPTLFQRSYFLMALLYLTPVLPIRD
ncbi:proton-coupled folate transporter-like isoform X2 [Dysidea avara]|uniref:proton-coupled folate transporter-like isoform X2 n=1 Tax=Dysidea avara TaxID=196820 RepID=UPI003317FB29